MLISKACELGAWEEVAKEQNKIAVFLCDSLERCTNQVSELEKVVHAVHENILLHEEKSMQKVAQVSAHAFKALSKIQEKRTTGVSLQFWNHKIEKCTHVDSTLSLYQTLSIRGYILKLLFFYAFLGQRYIFGGKIYCVELP